ncbi:hypothetical protein ES703_98422 [subsurface metagenome]
MTCRQGKISFQLHRPLPELAGAGPGGGRRRDDSLTIVGTHVHEAEDAHARLTIVDIKQGWEAQGVAHQQGEGSRQADLHVAVVGLAGENVCHNIIINMVLPLWEQDTGPVKEGAVGENGYPPGAQGILNHVQVNIGAGDVQGGRVQEVVGKILPQAGVEDHHHVIVHYIDIAVGGRCDQTLGKQRHQQGVAGVLVRHRAVAGHVALQDNGVVALRKDPKTVPIEGDLPVRNALKVVGHCFQLGVEVGHVMRRRVHQEAITAEGIGLGELHEESPIARGGEVIVDLTGKGYAQGKDSQVFGLRVGGCNRSGRPFVQGRPGPTLAIQGQAQEQGPAGQGQPGPDRKNPTLAPARDFPGSHRGRLKAYVQREAHGVGQWMPFVPVNIAEVKPVGAVMDSRSEGRIPDLAQLVIDESDPDGEIGRVPIFDPDIMGDGIQLVHNGGIVFVALFALVIGLVSIRVSPWLTFVPFTVII